MPTPMPTGVRTTPKLNAMPRTPPTVFKGDSAAAPLHDTSLDEQLGVPNDGNCLFWAFGVLLATYGVYDKTKRAYVQQHMQPSAIRNRLAYRIRDVRHWSSHFLRILNLVRDINNRPLNGVNGPRPADLGTCKGSVDEITKILKDDFEIDVVDRLTVITTDETFVRMTQAQHEAATDPLEEDENKLKSKISEGKVSPIYLQLMQYIVDTYIETSLSRNGQFAEAFEVELLAEEFGVIVYYYVGGAEHHPLERRADFDAAQLAHVMFPDPETRRGLQLGEDTAKKREEAKQRGFHLVRLGNHFYYGLRPPHQPLGGTPPARPWRLRPVAAVPYAAATTKRARLQAGRCKSAHVAATAHHEARAVAKPGSSASGRTPAEKQQAAMTAELHQVHMAARRRVEQGHLAQGNPHNANPGYSAAAMSNPRSTAVHGTAASALAPPAMPTTPVLARGSPFETTPVPPRALAWGSAGARPTSGYAQHRWQSAVVELEATLRKGADAGAVQEALFAVERAKTAVDLVKAQSGVVLAAEGVHDPRDAPHSWTYRCDYNENSDKESDSDASCDVGCGPTYDNDDIELELAAIEAALSSEIALWDAM